MYPQKVFKEKTIIISANQSVSVSELGLTIKTRVAAVNGFLQMENPLTKELFAI
jgi:hypothetical protein